MSDSRNLLKRKGPSENLQVNFTCEPKEHITLLSYWQKRRCFRYTSWEFQVTVHKKTCHRAFNPSFLKFARHIYRMYRITFPELLLYKAICNAEWVGECFIYLYQKESIPSKSVQGLSNFATSLSISQKCINVRKSECSKSYIAQTPTEWTTKRKSLLLSISGFVERFFSLISLFLCISYCFCHTWASVIFFKQTSLNGRQFPFVWCLYPIHPGKTNKVQNRIKADTTILAHPMNWKNEKILMV